ncbi:MAG: GNAT family N-acetyltransferase [Candidatus Aminicenantes bacterium]|nr:GNAT family N-acetyltransferase [Candidatus Aminicenantes bacterium]NIM78028.1 GNAT family N-acetyltransferase [Candidatus Aminicenantes bacterium]NIN17348.1 GNAT family N-acetyltransferase [Candidatus Aminicenantes bacterium]NIN41241.1 GNAT family N-acetyltransferase [Candidatus Aminicenantes bacterium]NIN84014.1 GNAT family N-acetyltransferase [Candidatus Aminicenantes bacterium]
MGKKTNIKIRKAVLKDVETIAKFNMLAAKETENMEVDPDTALRGAKAIIKDPHKGFYLVAEMKGQIIGQLMVTNEWSDWRNKYFLWVQSVYVLEDSRKQGIFSALFHHLKEMARYRKDVAGLRLYVERYNEAAKMTYESLGMHNPGYDIYEVLL